MLSRNDYFNLKTVVIDPGYGGKDPGSIGTGRYKVWKIFSDISTVGRYIKSHFPEINVIYKRKWWIC